MTTLSPLPIWQQLDGNGKPYAGGLLYTYASGTIDPKPTYDKDGNVNPNPVQFNSDGRATIRLEGGRYSMTFTDGAGATLFHWNTIEGVTVWSVNDIGGSGSDVFLVVDSMADLLALDDTDAAMVVTRFYAQAGDGGGGLFTWNPDATDNDGGINVIPTGHSGSGRWVRQFTGGPNPRWWGAIGNGSTDDSDAFIAALDYATANITGIELDHGIFKVTNSVDFSAIPVTFNAAALSWTGYNLSINPVIAIADTDQHFYFDPGDEPEFPDDPAGKYAEIKYCWLDGTTPGWYQSSLGNDISALDVRMDAAESTILYLTGQVDAIGTDVTTIKDVTIPAMQAEIDALEVMGAGVLSYGSLMLTGSGFQGTAPKAHVNWRKDITGTSIQAVILSGENSWLAGKVVVTIDGTPYEQDHVSDIETNLLALATSILADPNVVSSVYSTAKETLCVVFKAGVAPAVVCDTSDVTGGGGATLMTFVQRDMITATVSMTQATGIGNNSAITLGTLPTEIRPVGYLVSVPMVFSASTIKAGIFRISTAGVLSLYEYIGSSSQYLSSVLTSGVSYTFGAFTVQYPIATA
jgi:hypothetical protein